MQQPITNDALGALVAFCATGPRQNRAKHRRELIEAIRADGWRKDQARTLAQRFIAERRKVKE